MKGALGSPVAAAAAGAAMQESFGCVVANRFHQLLDDESDPFDILREAERRRQQQLQRKRRDEAAAAAAGAGNRGGRSPAGASGHRAGAGGGRRESQKERKSLPAPGAQQPDSTGAGPQPPGQKRTPRRGEQQGWNDSRGSEVTLDRAERRSYREYRPCETERQEDFTAEKFTDEKPIDRFDRDRPLRGRGGPRGGMRSRGRGGPGNRAFDGFDQRGRREFERYGGNDKIAIRTEDNIGGCGVRTWGSGRDTRSYVETSISQNTFHIFGNNVYRLAITSSFFLFHFDMGYLYVDVEPAVPMEEVTVVESLGPLEEEAPAKLASSSAHRAFASAGPSATPLPAYLE
ncbi:hypothetical protein HPG69_007622 [Diceros bicornis minor]|uniref:Intracellular hyaluronan-binding protein 4 n=1 Tax=Diceros bicornis minor TaxID=77932 RepID=A0A7J7EAK5_DICBM|nr:hypothetical protein HPG69_007622 [Diceros bicornis minor]